jgi:hypothetical protein
MHADNELIERARRQLVDQGLPCTIAGAAPEAAIASAEEAIGCAFPPSYRRFLAGHGALVLPPRASTIAEFCGITDPLAGRLAHSSSDADGKGVVERTLHARVENRLGESLIIVALGAELGEWFCIDTSRPRADGECPILLFDARDNSLDQQFYEDFGQMLDEVLTFVLETLDAGDDMHEVSQSNTLGGSIPYEG